MRDKILKILKENKEFLKKQYGITKLGLFGSVARDEKNPNAVDILFDFNNSSFDLIDMVKVKHFLEDKSDKKVDFVPLKGLKDKIKQYIQKEVIYV
jgi:predicted nucleotidyltransferase